MAWISSFIVFHIGLTIGVGMKGLDFLEYQWLIPLITVENFLQIVGMGYVVVRFLYPLDLAPKKKRGAILTALAAND